MHAFRMFGQAQINCPVGGTALQSRGGHAAIRAYSLRCRDILCPGAGVILSILMAEKVTLFRRSIARIRLKTAVTSSHRSSQPIDQQAIFDRADINKLAGFL